MSILLTTLIPVISLLLAILPFWYVRKKFGVEKIKWQHVTATFFIAIILLVIFQFIAFESTDLIIENVKNYDPPVNGIENGIMFSWFLIIILASISPFLIIRYFKKRFTWKNVLLALIIAIVIFTILAIILLNFMAWGVGAAFSNLG